MSEPATAEKIQTDPVVEAVPELEKPTPPGRGRFDLHEQSNQKWRLNVPIGIKPEQCMDEDYYQHLGIHLKPGDEIRVMPDDMSWELVLHVVGAGRAYAHVVKKALYVLANREDQVKLPSIYKVEHAGTTHKWRILRNGELLKDGFQTEALARRAAAQHENAVSR